jgi:hypothetical protein
MLRILCLYLPVVAGFCFNVAFYMFALKHNSHLHPKMLADFARYLPAFVCVWTVPLLDVAYQFVYGADRFMQLVCARAVRCRPSGGEQRGSR